MEKTWEHVEQLTRDDGLTVGVAEVMTVRPTTGVRISPEVLFLFVDGKPVELDKLPPERASEIASTTPLPSRKLGTTDTGGYPSSSSMEIMAGQHLWSGGLPVVKLGIRTSAGPVVPSFLLPQSGVAVEVDNRARAADSSREALLSELGWLVIRLRMGGLPPFSEHDVCVPQETFTPEMGNLLGHAVAALALSKQEPEAGRKAYLSRRRAALGGLTL